MTCKTLHHWLSVSSLIGAGTPVRATTPKPDCKELWLSDQCGSMSDRAVIQYQPPPPTKGRSIGAAVHSIPLPTYEGGDPLGPLPNSGFSLKTPDGVPLPSERPCFRRGDPVPHLTSRAWRTSVTAVTYICVVFVGDFFCGLSPLRYVNCNFDIFSVSTMFTSFWPLHVVIFFVLLA